MIRLGSVVKLTCYCLGNSAGTVGLVINDYGTGVQVIFPNGEYDGFSRVNAKSLGYKSEIDLFLTEEDWDKELALYEFTTVIQLDDDFRRGVFDKVLKQEVRA
jgi:hypothetical protein